MAALGLCNDYDESMNWYFYLMLQFKILILRLAAYSF
jgi:hypothetical protein